MGYSIGTRARGAKLQKEMIAFLRRHYRKWSEVAIAHESHQVGLPTDDADYDDAKHFVGFNYSCSWGWDRFYTTVSCRWVALKVGRRRRTFAKDVVTPNAFPDPVPFITYDGYQNWPVLAVGEEAAKGLPVGQQWCATDEWGVPAGPGRWEDYSDSCAEDGLFGDHDGVRAAWDKITEESAAADWEGREKRGEIVREQWIKEMQALRVKHLRPFMEEAFDKVREEMKRLDGLWEEEHGS
jgi:hypothetical protein